jgi:hypothetical protein
MTVPYRIATGLEFQPLADGNVRIEFHDDGAQSVLAAIDQGAEVAEKLVGIIRAAEEAEDGSHE